jgi:hypothetical protein
VTFSAVGIDGPSTNTISGQATDSGGLTATAQAVVNVLNVAPVTGVIGAPLGAVKANIPITAAANFSDVGTLDTHHAVWDWGDGNTSPGVISEAQGAGVVSGNHTYASAGVYTVNLTVTDDDNASDQPDEPFRYVVVYDPNAGFVTGTGSIDSPPGSYVSNASLTGKAVFGFVAKYRQGAEVPTGNTRFRFHTADLDFSSTDYQWLVIAGARAQFKGTGTINGSGNYAFLLTAVDGQISGGGGLDKFRIKIWELGMGEVIYDNQTGSSDNDVPTTVLASGSIAIHK